MTTPDPRTIRTSWRKSSYSGGTADGNCVQVAHSAEAVAVRDSKHSAGPTVAVSPAAWHAFLATTRH